jgi:predicted dehydrogenase
MPRNPLVSFYLERLRSGEFGEVRGFVGVTLLSFVQGTATKRWEVNKNSSGGGVLINSGGHVLSMIRTALGDPETLEVESRKLYSVEIEDSIVITFGYPSFTCKHYCSWSVHGYLARKTC